MVTVADVYYTLGLIADLDKTDDSRLRRIDGQIAFCLYAEAVDKTTYRLVGSEEGGAPYALVRQSAQSHTVKDVIQFQNPSVDGWIVMASAKVPHYTTSFDRAFELLHAQPHHKNYRWSVTEKGAVTVKVDNRIYKSKMLSVPLSICAIGMTICLDRVSLLH